MSRVGAVILTYNALSTGRRTLLDQTIADLYREADYVQVVDNASSDGSDLYVSSLGGYCHRGPLHTSGHGTNLQARVARGSGCDRLVFSDDDIAWPAGWRTVIDRWWDACPDDIALLGCHLEPFYTWNQVTGRIDIDGIPALLRNSTGAATWSLRADDLAVLFGPCGIWQQNQGYGDVMGCDRLIERGRKIAQIDLATHAGQGMSTWGNATEHRYGWDLGPARELLNRKAAVA